MFPSVFHKALYLHYPVYILCSTPFVTEYRRTFLVITKFLSMDSWKWHLRISNCSIWMYFLLISCVYVHTDRNRGVKMEIWFFIEVKFFYFLWKEVNRYLEIKNRLCSDNNSILWYPLGLGFLLGSGPMRRCYFYSFLKIRVWLLVSSITWS